MFIEYFQMNAHPFMENPPSRWLICDERFEQALARLKFFREQGRLALIFGQTGVGKSTLLRMFQKELPHNRCHPIFFHITNVKASAFLRMIVSQMGESPRLGKDRMFLQIINRLQNSETETILVIDEAHLLPSEALTDLRLLISSGIDTHLPLKIILSGQESLSATLKRNEHADLVGRVSVQFRMSPLKKIQTVAYIEHRLKCVEATAKLFDAEAKSLIHDYSGGIPRQINNIATACLIDACAKNQTQISPQIVNETMAEFRLP